MTEEQAIEIAQAVASENGWGWQDPAVVEYRKPLFGRRGRWHVLSNGGNRGTNVRVVVDDVTGEVLEKGYVPL